MTDVPVLPVLPPDVVARRQSAHERLAQFVSSAHPTARTQAAELFRRLLVEAMANVFPVFRDVAHPMLLPPPRRFLTEVAEQRLRGAAAAFRFVDSAATMATMPSGRPVLEASTPLVLNALLAGPVTERETNAGLVRVTPTNWMPDANAFEHPPPEDVGELLTAAIDLAARAPAPAIARAGWLAFTTMTVHPFVDGNGRTARALFLATLTSATPGGIDWGVLDQWHLARTDYVRALQAGQRADRYAGAAVDPLPFMAFAAESSTRGAELAVARVRLLGELVEQLTGVLDDESVAIAVGTIVDRSVPLVPLLDDAVAMPETAERISELVDREWLAFAELGTGAPRAQRGRRSVIAGPALAPIAAQARAARWTG